MKCALLKKASGAGWSPVWSKAGDINNARGSAIPIAGMTVIRWNSWCLQCCEAGVLHSVEPISSEGENEFSLGKKGIELGDFEGGCRGFQGNHPSSAWTVCASGLPCCWNLQDSMGSSLGSQGVPQPHHCCSQHTLSPAPSSTARLSTKTAPREGWGPPGSSCLVLWERFYSNF